MFIERDQYQRGINWLAFGLLVIVPLLMYPDGRRFNVAISKSVGLAIVSLIFFGLILAHQTLSLRPDQKSNRWLIVYSLLLVVSTFFALNPKLAIFGSTARRDGLLTFVGYIVAYSLGRQVRFKAGFYWAIMGSSLLISGFALLQFFQIDPAFLQLYPDSWKSYAFSTMGNPNFLGSYLVLILPLPMYAYFKQNRLSGLLIYSVTYFALLATRTRGAWIGAFFGFFCMVYLSYRASENKQLMRRKLVIIMLVSAILFGLFIVATDGTIIQKILALFSDFYNVMAKPEDAEFAGTNRVYVWKRCIELIKQRPIFGYGVENMSIAMRQQFHDEIVQDFGRYRNWDKAHNEYLNIAVASGIPSLLVYLGFCFSSLGRGFKRLKNQPMFMPLVAAAVGYMVQAFFNIQMIMVYYFFMAVLGMLVSDQWDDRNEEIDGGTLCLDDHGDGLSRGSDFSARSPEGGLAGDHLSRGESRTPRVFCRSGDSRSERRNRTRCATLKAMWTQTVEES